MTVGYTSNNNRAPRRGYNGARRNDCQSSHQSSNDSNASNYETIKTFQKTLDAAIGELSNLESPSLRLTKLLMLYIINEDNCKNGSKKVNELRQNEIDKICDCANNKRFANSNCAVDAMKRLPGNVCFRMALAARMMVNQSGSVLNLGILLHRNYSCPYIPGSALKGITRHYAVEQYGAKDAAVLRIFGAQDNAGSVAFMNAFPASGSNWKLVSDVLTRHNDPSDNGPMDTKNPVPIVFPAVEKGAQFDFIVAPARACVASSDVELAAKWLREALQENGVGAKTSAGYGWFREM